MSDKKPWESAAPITATPSVPPFLAKTENRGINRLGMLAGPNTDVSAIVNKGSNQKLARKAEGRSPAEKQLLWSRFASEYLRDYNVELAYIRACGTVGKKVGKNPYLKGYTMLKQPFVQELIKQVVDSLNEEELVTRKDIVMGLWKEAHDTGEGSSGGARVRALMGLARIKKMDIQVIEQETKVTNVMRVPIPPDNDAWAAAAEQSQRELKEDVRT